jgi:predicted enzyme related to lactoylglutathione lyase
MTAPQTRSEVLGLGGLFFKSPDPTRLREWYERVLGLTFNSWGGIAFDPATLPANSRTVFSPFAADTDYFRPSDRAFMFNLIVADLQAALARAEAAGAQVLPERTSGEYGDFGWIIDCDGNKIELWQPPAAA